MLENSTNYLFTSIENRPEQSPTTGPLSMLKLLNIRYNEIAEYFHQHGMSLEGEVFDEILEELKQTTQETKELENPS